MYKSFPKTKRANCVYSLITSVIYKTSKNKTRFWLKADHMDCCGIFSSYNKNSLACWSPVWTSGDTDCWSSITLQLTSAIAHLSILTSFHTFNTNKRGGTLYFWHLTFMRSTGKKIQTWHTNQSFLFPPCSLRSATFQVLKSQLEHNRFHNKVLAWHFLLLFQNRSCKR